MPFVAHSIQHLLATAAVGSEPSLNIPFLTKLFEKQQNIDILLSGSSLYDWARSAPWDTRTACPNPQGPADIGDENEGVTGNGVSVSDDEDSGTSDISDVEDVDANSETTATFTTLTAATPDYGGETTNLSHVFVNTSVESELTSSTATPMQSYEDSHPGAEKDAPLRPKKYDEQLSAKLHCLYGAPINSIRRDPTASRYTLRGDTRQIHPWARSRVYDLRQHSDHTLWGPFLDDGSLDVDWEKVEAIMVILNYNLKLSAESHRGFEGMMNLPNKPFTGTTPYSFASPKQSVPMEPAISLEAQDPYNVTGTWMRVVCFLDYTDLFEFNFNNDPVRTDQPRGPIYNQEAIRLITMKIRVTKIQPPGEEDGQRLPVVHFQGKSASLKPSWDPNANSKIKGGY